MLITLAKLERLQSDSEKQAFLKTIFERRKLKPYTLEQFKEKYKKQIERNGTIHGLFVVAYPHKYDGYGFEVCGTFGDIEEADGKLTFAVDDVVRDGEVVFYPFFYNFDDVLIYDFATVMENINTSPKINKQLSQMALIIREALLEVYADAKTYCHEDFLFD